MNFSGDNLAHYKEIIDTEIENLVFPSTPNNLYDPIRYLLNMCKCQFQSSTAQFSPVNIWKQIPLKVPLLMEAFDL